MNNLTIAGTLLLIGIATITNSATCATEQVETLPEARQVLERYAEAIGGPDAVALLSTRVCLGKMVHDLHWSRPPYEVVPIAGYASSSGQVLMVEHTSNGLRCEGFDGDVTWVQAASGFEIRDERIRSKIAWVLDPHGAIRMEEYFPDLKVTSKENLEGRAVYVLEPADLDRAHYALYFDAETGLLVRIGYYWELKDYRVVDGIRLPHRIDMSRKGGSSTLVLDMVAHNLPLEDRLFAVPDSAKALED